VTAPNALELCVYRDGDPITPALFFNSMIGPNYSDRYRLPHRERAPFEVIVGIDWGEEVSPHWWSFTAWLSDVNHAPLAPHRPGLFYAQPSDCPTVVTFISNQSRMQDPMYGGLLVLMLRGKDRYTRHDITVEKGTRACKCGGLIVDGVCQTRAAEESA
jgi:hypothetical protein